MHQRLRQTDALQHPFRISPDAPLCRLRQPDPRDHLRHPGRQSRSAQAANPPVKRHQLPPAEKAIKVRRFGQIAHRHPRFHPITRHAKNPARSGRWRQQTQNDLDGRALARAIGPEQAEHFTPADAQAQVIHRPQSHPAQPGRKILRQPFQLHGRFGPARHTILNPLNCPARSP